MNLKIKRIIRGTYKDAFIYGKTGLWNVCCENGIVKKITRSQNSESALHKLIPSMTDTHNHFMAYGITQVSADLQGTTTIEEIKEKIRTYIKAYSPNFVIAEGWDENFIKEKRMLEKSDLNNISKRIPVLARRLDGHITIINDFAIKYLKKLNLKVNEDGILLEELSLSISNYFEYSNDLVRLGMRKAIENAKDMGVSGVCDFLTERYYNYYINNLDLLSDFQVDYYLIHPFYIENPMENENFHFKGMKTFLDGSIGANTAMVSFPYLNGKGNGKLIYSDDELIRLIGISLTKFEKIALHAIGDIAIEQALDTIEYYKNESDRFRLEHLEFITKEQIARLSKLKTGVSMQPNFIGMWGNYGGMYEEKFGDIFIKNNPIKSVRDAAYSFSFGSDDMPFSPAYGIYWATNHPNKGESLTLDEAIKSYLGTPLNYLNFLEED